MAHKLTTPPFPRYGMSSPKKQVMEVEKSKNRSKVEDHSPTRRQRRFDPTMVRFPLSFPLQRRFCNALLQPLSQRASFVQLLSFPNTFPLELPKPCGWFYLTQCRNGGKCKYAHDYERTPELMHALRAVMKRTVCDKIAKSTSYNAFAPELPMTGLFIQTMLVQIAPASLVTTVPAVRLAPNSRMASASSPAVSRSASVFVAPFLTRLSQGIRTSRRGPASSQVMLSTSAVYAL
jgi:hypothetical protein